MDELTKTFLGNLPETTGNALYAGSIGAFLGGAGSGILHAAINGMDKTYTTERIADLKNTAAEMKRMPPEQRDVASEVINNASEETAYIDVELALRHMLDNPDMDIEGLGVTRGSVENSARNVSEIEVPVGTLTSFIAENQGFMDAV